MEENAGGRIDGKWGILCIRLTKLSEKSGERKNSYKKKTDAILFDRMLYDQKELKRILGKQQKIA